MELQFYVQFIEFNQINNLLVMNQGSVLAMEELIGDALVEKFGYSRPMNIKNKTITVQGFEPLSNKERISYLKQEIDDLDASLYSNRVEKEFFPEYSKLVQKKIREYNYIVSYKHIKDNRLETTEISGEHHKTREEDIFSRMQALKKELMKKENLKDNIKQFNLNKELNEVFREYQHTILNATVPGKLNTHNSNKMTQHVINSINKTYNHPQSQIQPQLNYSFALGKNISKRSTVSNPPISSKTNSIVQHKKIAEGFTNYKIPKIVFHYQQEKGNVAIGKMQKLLDPFSAEESNSLMESKKIEMKKIQNEKEILDYLKTRVQEFRESQKRSTQKEQKQQSRQGYERRSSNRKQRGISSGNNNLNPKPSNQRIQNIKIIDEYQQQNMEDNSNLINNARMKKNIFAEIIKKRNNRFVKPKGTKILVEFNSTQAAKLLLEGRPNGYSGEVQSAASKFRSTLRTSEVEEDYSNIEILEGPPRRAIISNDYSSEYKNQKINASLRAKKHQ